MNTLLYRFLSRMSIPAIALLSLLLLLLVGIFHYSLDPQVSTSLFYLLPVSVAAFFGSRYLGFGIAILSALIWFINDLVSDLVYAHPLIGLWNSVMRMQIFIFIAYLISALRSALKAAAQAADLDPLMGLANRRRFGHELQGAFYRSARSGCCFSLAYIDVDNFKQVNDEHGHKEGDRLLIAMAQELSVSVRHTDHVVRLGGDEFVILMPATDMHEVRIPIENCRKNLTLRMAADNWPVSFSVGVVTFDRLPDDIEQTLVLADRLMYQVKSNGKDRVLYSVWRGEESAAGASSQ